MQATGAMVAAVGLLLVVAAAAAAPRPLNIMGASSSKRNATAISDPPLSVYFHVDSCPQLETIVRSTVDAALRQNGRLTAGLLRIFFHDCFPQGCDASVLLEDGERRPHLAPNVGLQDKALDLIEAIRSKVHAACGSSVSCADILVLATRDAVNLAGGPSFSPPLGRMDARAPASDNDVFTLPPPTADVDTLLANFSSKGLTDPADLVALSGAHTVGKARCSSFGDVAPATDDLTGCLTAKCAAPGSADQLRDLDFLTPSAFDNLYFVELMLKKSKGVMLPSDQGLATHPRTNWLVQGFADNHWWFFDQFATSMVRMSQLRGPQGNVGEIRRNCFRPNSRSTSTSTSDGGVAAASA